ncbi:aspartyl-tRNA amidotransferase subunit B [Bacteroidota bacterium]|nr:aspartyl-tRNA amidotransferase subunit B [Bacteroidota bacterium]
MLVVLLAQIQINMTLEQKVMAEMKEAMKNKDEGTLRGLRAIKAAIILAKTEKGFSGEITEDAEIKILQKLLKQRKDSLEIFNKENRPDLAQKEKEEIAVIEKFLPTPLTEDELRVELRKIIADSGAIGPSDLGKVMGIASKSFAGKADGKTISSLVKELLGA